MNLTESLDMYPAKIKKKKYLVRCPKCGNKQIIEIRAEFPTGHQKRCVYCGKTWIIHHNPHSSTIIKEIIKNQDDLI